MIQPENRIPPLISRPWYLGANVGWMAELPTQGLDG